MSRAPVAASVARRDDHVAARHRRRRRHGNAEGADARPRRPGLARPSRGPARGRAADGGGWLPGAAELLHCVGAGGRPRRADGRTTGRWRGLAVPHGRAARRGSARAAWADRRVLRLGRRARRTRSPRGGWLGDRAADGDAAPSRGRARDRGRPRPARRASTTPVLVAAMGRRDLP